MNTPTKFLALLAMSCATLTVHAEKAFENNQYEKALWMTTRFYGAQRSGYGPNWLTAQHNPTPSFPYYFSDLANYSDNIVTGKSYLKDADIDGYDLTGGWFDCGDFVKFGNTEYYSAYLLLLGFSEFPKGYRDFYSADYKGYIGTNDFSWEGKAGIPNGVPDILDEVKYATDYFIKCVRNEQTFYYQVGDPDTDHQLWLTSVFKSALPLECGGEAEGSRPIKKLSQGGTSMVAFCGASLASMSRLYRVFDADYADLCLEKALQAYAFMNENPRSNIEAVKSTNGSDIFYGKKQNYLPDCAIFCIELYRATGDSTYLNKAKAYAEEAKSNGGWRHGYALNYNNTEDIFLYLMAKYGNEPTAVQILEYLIKRYERFDENEYDEDHYILKNVKGEKPMRLAANEAFVIALYQNLIGNKEEIEPHVQTTIDYLMGANEDDFSFIAGFSSKGTEHPHHRNYYLKDSWWMSDNFFAQKKYKELGCLVGGNFNLKRYNDDISSYLDNESGIDFNAGLVGALGYMNSIFSPETNWIGEDTSFVGTNKANIKCLLYPNPATNKIAIQSEGDGNTFISIFNAEGKCELQKNCTWNQLECGIDISHLAKGQHIINITTKEGAISKQFTKK